MTYKHTFFTFLLFFLTSAYLSLCALLFQYNENTLRFAEERFYHRDVSDEDAVHHRTKEDCSGFRIRPTDPVANKTTTPTMVPLIYNTAIQVPVFLTEDDLRNDLEWWLYFNRYYGVEALTFPLSVRTFAFFYDELLPQRLREQMRPHVARTVSLQCCASGACKAGEIPVKTWTFTLSTNLDWVRLSLYWVATPAQLGFLPMEDFTTVEILHGNRDMWAQGFWMFYAPGSGIWYNVGTTKVLSRGTPLLSSHQSLCLEWGGSPNVCQQEQARNIFNRMEGLKRGYDSLQFPNGYTCGTNHPCDIRWEIVDLRDGWGADEGIGELLKIWIGNGGLWGSMNWSLQQLKANARALLAQSAALQRNPRQRDLLEHWLLSSMYRTSCHNNMTLFRRGHPKAVSHCECDPGRNTLNCDGSGSRVTSSLPAVFGLRQREAELTILFTSDVHGHIETLPQLVAATTALRAASTHVILVDVGDVFVGTRFFEEQGPAGMAKVMRYIGYQAMTVGNHDLEFQNDLEAFSRNASIPLVLTNARNMAGIRRSTVVVTRAGLQVGIVGYVSAVDAEGKGVDNIGNDVKIAAALVTEAIRLRKTENCSYVIALAHGGSVFDTRVAQLTAPHITATLSGHSHAVLHSNGSFHSADLPVIVSAGSEGRYLGVLRITPPFGRAREDSNTKSKTNNTPKLRAHTVHSSIRGKGRPFPQTPSASSFVIDLRGKNAPQDSSAMTFLHQLDPPRARDLLAISLQPTCEPSAHHSTPLMGSSDIENTRLCRDSSCAWGSYVADAMWFMNACNGTRSVTRIQAAVVPTLALREAGTLRGVVPSGALSMSSLIELFPWNNPIVSTQMSGRAITAALEHGAGSLARFGGSGGALLQVSGLKYHIDINRQRGSRVRDVEVEVDVDLKDACSHSTAPRDVRYTPLSLDDVYSVAVTDWFWRGGDGFPDLSQSHNASVEHLGRELDVMRAYFAHGAAHVHTFQPHKRILFTVASEATFLYHAVIDLAPVFVASLLATIAAYPLLLLTVRRISSDAGKYSPVEGPTKIEPGRRYPGLLLTLTGNGVSDVLFWLFVFVFEHIFAATRGHIMSTTLAAMLQVIFTNPLWVVVTRMQTDDSLSPSQHATHVWRHGDACRGLVPGLMLTIYPVTQLAVYSFLCPDEPSAIQGLLFGTAAALVACAITYPLLYIRTRLQSGSPLAWSSLWSAPENFMRGFGYKLMHSATFSGSFFFFKEIIDQLWRALW